MITSEIKLKLLMYCCVYKNALEDVDQKFAS